MTRLSVVLLAVGGLAVAGCGKPKCNDHTVFVTIDFDAATSNADSLEVDLSLAGAPVQSTAVARKGGSRSSTLQVDFGGKYAAGSSFDISVVASSQGSVVGSGSASHALDSGCTALSLSVAATGGNEDLPALVSDLATPPKKDAAVSADAAIDDLSTQKDLSTPDLLPPADMVVTCAVPGPLSGALISDFETSVQILNSDQLPSWAAVNDGTGTQSPAPLTTITPTTLTPSRGTSTKAIHTTGSGFTNFAQLSGTFYGGYPADASAYSGITFWAMGSTSKSGNFQVIVDTGPVEPVCGICTACYDGFVENFTITSSWQQYTLHWNDVGLVPNGYGSPETPALDPHSISTIAFSMSGSFDIWFDDVSFIP